MSRKKTEQAEQVLNNIAALNGVNLGIYLAIVTIIIIIIIINTIRSFQVIIRDGICTKCVIVTVIVVHPSIKLARFSIIKIYVEVITITINTTTSYVMITITSLGERYHFGLYGQLLLFLTMASCCMSTECTQHHRHQQHHAHSNIKVLLLLLLLLLQITPLPLDIFVNSTSEIVGLLLTNFLIDWIGRTQVQTILYFCAGIIIIDFISTLS